MELATNQAAYAASQQVVEADLLSVPQCISVSTLSDVALIRFSLGLRLYRPIFRVPLQQTALPPINPFIVHCSLWHLSLLCQAWHSASQTFPFSFSRCASGLTRLLAAWLSKACSLRVRASHQSLLRCSPSIFSDLSHSSKSSLPIANFEKPRRP